MFALPLWLLLLVRLLVWDPRKSAPVDLALFERECDFLIKALPVPRSWLTRLLIARVIKEIDVHRSAALALDLMQGEALVDQLEKLKVRYDAAIQEKEVPA